jgi:uncharacterized membrane protein YhaH (DUF805 family)
MKKFKFLNDTIHGVLDYGVVVIFAVAPSLLGIAGPSAVLCYLLAAVHLLVTILSDMPFGVKKLIPMSWHGHLELVVGLALVIAPWVFSDLLASGQLFFTLMGAVIFFVWATSNYGDKKFAALA